MDAGIRGKKALITGAGTGIGRAIAFGLAGEGVDVAVASRNPDPRVVQDLKALGVNAVRITADVSNEAEVNRMVREAIDGLGGLDFYINNSAGHWDEATTKVTSEGFMNSINTNLSACVYACRGACKRFIEQGSGSVLIVGSTCLYTPLSLETGYRVSKTGLVAYMQVLACEMAPYKIRVNMVTPGLFITRVSQHLTNPEHGEGLSKILREIPLRRPGDLEGDIGPAAVFLLSDKLSGYTTGVQLPVDGGVSLREFPYFSDEEKMGFNK